MTGGAPIGMFDSGVGGLTVLDACLVRLPHEDFIYLGDTGRFPYGPRSRDELLGYARELYGLLEARGVKLVVVACNSATAAALPALQREARLPVLGVVTPEAHAAWQATRNRRVGLLATEATVASGRYEEAIHDLDAGIELVAVPCPGLAEAIQGEHPVSEHTLALVQRACEPLRQAGVDTVILGCTHYPLVAKMLQRELGPDVELVAAADELAREVAETLRRKGWGNEADRRGDYTFLSTGDPRRVRDARNAVPPAPGSRGRDRAGRGARLSRRAAAASLPRAPGSVGVVSAAAVVRVPKPTGLRVLALRAAGACLVTAFEAGTDPRAHALLPPPLPIPAPHGAHRWHVGDVVSVALAQVADDAGQPARRPRHDARARPAGTSSCRSPATRAREAALCRVRAGTGRDAPRGPDAGSA